MEFDKEKLPTHVAIIMDGNRRWAKARGRGAAYGHKEGVKNLEKIVRYAYKIGLKYITVYAFSTENWKRTEEEVSSLMFLFKTYLDDYAKRADTENIKVNFIGDISAFNKDLQNSMKNCIEKTKNNTGTVFTIALNDGGRNEIIKAIKEISEEVKSNFISVEDINEEIVSNHLYTKDIPDPDLIIRTSNEIRLSGFLIWQASHSEFYFAEKNWPDFDEEEFNLAIETYQKRNRRFGGN